MPRYFIDIYDHEVTRDEVGHVLSSLEAVRQMVRRTLAALIADATHADATELRAEVRDEGGRHVMTVTLGVTISQTRGTSG